VARHYHGRGETLVLFCHIQTGARRTELAGIHGNRLKVRLQAPPVAGKTNAALIDFLAHTFKVGKADMAIRHDRASRHKTVAVRQPGRLPTGCEIDAGNRVPK
jgi:uncharacterized protein (TIGR00251 family)